MSGFINASLPDPSYVAGMTISITTPVATAFDLLTDRLGAVCDRVAPRLWDAPSPCEEWTARDVLSHVVGTEREFLGKHGVALPEVDLADDPAAGWHMHADALRTAVADPDLTAREYDSYFGPTTIGDTLMRFYGLDLVVHRWDIATAAGLPERLADDELALVETCTEGFGDMLYAEGVCRAGVQAPSGADRQARVLATLGRTS
jgi:uncharacterized protein (TIGR03086 family)